MKIGVYVGSFNPVHKGHINLVHELLNKKIVDKVIIVPSRNYWDKQNLINIKDRVEMLKYYQSDDIIIDENKSIFDYTYQVLEKIKKEYLNSDIFLIIGADNLPLFHLWKNYEDIINNNYIIVIERNDIDIKKELKRFSHQEKFIITDIKVEAISSTMIRERIKNNLVNNDFLDKNVSDYINKFKLYKGE